MEAAPGGVEGVNGVVACDGVCAVGLAIGISVVVPHSRIHLVVAVPAEIATLGRLCLDVAVIDRCRNLGAAAIHCARVAVRGCHLPGICAHRTR